MTKYLLFIVLFLCLGFGSVAANSKSPLDMKCDVVESDFFNVYRCENTEIVCYFMVKDKTEKTYTELNCKWK